MDFNPAELIIQDYSEKPRSAWAPKPYTGVQIVHVPTGIHVRVDTGRSQHHSKNKALKELSRRIKNLSNKPAPSQVKQATSRELQDINEITQSMMAEFPDECTGRLSTILRTCHRALRENVKMKSELAEMKAQYGIVKNLCDEFEKELDTKSARQRRRDLVSKFPEIGE